MKDIVERLRDLAATSVYSLLPPIWEAADEIESLRADVAKWKGRYEAERADHEATIKHADEEMRRGSE